MNNRELALRFLKHFCAGDVNGLQPLLANSLCFEGPLYRFNSKQEYLSCLSADQPKRCEYRVLSITEAQSQVAVFYEYVKPDSAITVAHLFEFEKDTICRMHLVFDTSKVSNS